MVAELVHDGLTKGGRVGPQPGLGAPDDRLADEDEALVAHVLHRVPHQVEAVLEDAPIQRRKWTLTGNRLARGHVTFPLAV